MKVRSAIPFLLIGGITVILVLTSIMTAQTRTNDTIAAQYPFIERVPAQKPTNVAIGPNVNISHVVVKFKDDAAVRLRNSRMIALGDTSPAGAVDILSPYMDKRLRRLFADQDETRLDRQRDALQYKTGYELADLNGYYRIDVTDPNEAAGLINRLNALDIVEIAYFQPQPEEAEDIDPPTPDYHADQDYREAAPDGVDADYANTLPGGNGSGVKIIDIENNWQTTHEDLEKALGGVIGSYPGGGTTGHHGTAVLGEMVAGDNGYGMTGICPGADVGMVSVTVQSTAEALYTAIDNLEPGDHILIELHAPGPRYDFTARLDQLGYICMEYWQANFDAIQYAWAKGIVVVEAAGNGAEDFDDVIYEQVFDTTYRNSHAIIVGAGYPPASGQDRIRQSFSNYGERVNLQGYGSGVYSTGYGSLFDGNDDINQYYTSSFSGTSSASPIVTGASVCLQGYYKANYGVNLTSDMIRSILVQTGTTQAGDTTAHIGPRPNLAAAIPALSPPPSLYTNPILIDTLIDDSTVADISLWLYNRSITNALDFEITTQDTLDVKDPAEWLSASPSSGVIAAADSIEILVELDATQVENRLERYKGLLEIQWGTSGLPLDSITNVPVYLTVPCNDLTYDVISSDDPNGPVFDWISAKTLGAKINNSSFYNPGFADPLDDGSAGPRNIGFAFPFYDTSFVRFFIGVNGAISFTDTNINVSGYFSSIDIPGAPYATVVAPFYGDLIIDDEVNPEAGVYLYNPPGYDKMVIEWYHPGSFYDSGDTTINFEIILTRFGEIFFQYNDVGISSISSTVAVGIGTEGCAALNYKTAVGESYTGVNTGQVIRFKWAGQELVMAGNVNGEASIDISDLVYLVSYMFQGGLEPIPMEAADMNCSGGGPDISDLVYLVNYMFNSGPEPCKFWMSQ
ncbi:MAG TPA: S8 family serine peptidase [candidate division Zixibacteria bacterium]|nr:S8 family serine peptidase [candidate division Zixibacteria bacterium]